jgi:hypothetical protein
VLGKEQAADFGDLLGANHRSAHAAKRIEPSAGTPAQTATQGSVTGRSSTRHLLDPSRSTPQRTARRGRSRGLRDAARAKAEVATLIRHARRGAAPTVGPLTIAVVEPALRTLLVPTVGPPPLSSALFASTRFVAVAVPAKARATNPEHRAATIGPATLLKEEDLRAVPHPVPKAGLDTGASLMARSVSLCGACSCGATTETPIAANGRGFVSPPPERTAYSTSRRAFGADDAALPQPAGFQKTTFLGERLHHP